MDIPIVYTGIRPGEKLREELVGDGEERELTSHPRIFRIRNGSTLDELIALAEAQRNGEVVARLRELALSLSK